MLSLQKCLPFFFCSHLHMLIIMPYDMTLGQLGSAVLALSSFSSLCTPSPLDGGVRSRKGLGFVLALLSNNKNIPVLSTVYPAQI